MAGFLVTTTVGCWGACLQRDVLSGLLFKEFTYFLTSYMACFSDTIHTEEVREDLESIDHFSD